MKLSVWSVEKWRIVIVIGTTLVGGLLTGAWLLSLALSLLGYIIWIYFKVQQFYTWIINGTKQDKVPDSDGIWEQINYQVLQTKNKSNHRKKNMNALLKRSQSILKSFPYATIVINNNNQIDWSNKKSNLLLNIVKNDRGRRLDNLIRSPKLNKLLKAQEEVSEIEIESPQDPRVQLSLKLISISADSRLLIARDITLRNKTLEMRKNFISNASHELRTPLTVICGHLEMIKADKQLPEPLSDSVNIAYEQSERMRNIIEDLLVLSQIESDENIDEIGCLIDIQAIIQGVCKNLDAKITTDIKAATTLFGVETEIVSLCTNLIQNAIFYTPKDTPIIIRWYLNEHDNPCLDVQDFGKGIPVKHLDHLTDRFYRVDKGRSQKHGGTGLGLAIVKHIAHRHNATLSIQSKVGKGSTFSVCFSVV